MRIRHLGCIAALAAFSVSTAASAECQLQQIGVMPVCMQGSPQAQGGNDLAAAARLDSGIAPHFANMGLTP